MIKVLVTAVHPDDETLGCGGTILRHKKSGHDVSWLVVTAMTREMGYSEEQIETRRSEIIQVKEAYGFNEFVEFNIPTSCVDSLPERELVDKFCDVLNRIQPEIIYLPFAFDTHGDHRRVFNAFGHCLKTFRYPFVRRVLMMETMSETDFAAPLAGHAFLPNFYVDISAELERKAEIINIYASELRTHPFPRSEERIRAQALNHGAVAGCRFAEAFMILKDIWTT